MVEMLKPTGNPAEPYPGLYRIDKVQYRRWALDRQLNLFTRSLFNVPDLMMTLKRDYGGMFNTANTSLSINPYRMNKHDTCYVYSTGVDDFLFIIDDMQGDAFKMSTNHRTGEQYVTIFLIKEQDYVLRKRR